MKIVEHKSWMLYLVLCNTVIGHNSIYEIGYAKLCVLEYYKRGIKMFDQKIDLHFEALIERVTRDEKRLQRQRR